MGISHLFKDEAVEAANTERKRLLQKPKSLGRTELGRLVQVTNGAVNGATVQFPTVGYHTAIDSMMSLLAGRF